MSRPSFMGRGAVLALMAGLAGCQGSDASRPSRSLVNEAAASPRPARPTSPVAGPLPSSAEMPSLGERLASEAWSRPEGAVNMEALLAALGEKGMVIARTRQVVAQTIGGRYCAIAVTGEGLGLSVCEFGSAGEASAAEEKSHQRFDAAMPGRHLVLNGPSLLTIARAPSELEGQSQMVAAAFAALRAR